MCRQHAKQNGPGEPIAYEGQTRHLSAEAEQHGRVCWFWTPALIWLGIGLAKLLVVVAQQTSARQLLQPPTVLAVLCIGVGLWLIWRDSADNAKEASDGEDQYRAL